MKLKTISKAIAGLALAAGVAGSANAFSITSGDYKITVDGYVNGSLYGASISFPSSCGGATPTGVNIGSCDAAVTTASVGGVGSEDSWGIVSVATIQNTTTNTTMFSKGGADGFLIGSFTGITDFFSFVLGADQHDYATGGTIKLYKSATDIDQSIPSSGRAAVIASVTNLPLWLSLDFVAGAGNAAFDLGNLLYGIPAVTAATYASTFNGGTSQGAGFGFLEVTGGTAMASFDTNPYTTYAGLSADAYFSTTLTSPTANDPGLGNWLASSTSDVKGTSVPEPGSMALVGLGLMGLASLRRRKQQA